MQAHANQRQSSASSFHPSNYLPQIKLRHFPEAASLSSTLPKTETIKIAMGFDANYALHSLTSLASLFGTAQNPHRLEIYLLHPDPLAKTLREKFEKLAPLKTQIHFIEIDNELVSTLPIINQHITLATYYRLLLPSLIAAPKILWIDGDTILCEDIAKLWNEDLEGYLLAGVPDLDEKQEKQRLAHFYRTAEKNDAEIYINAGVSLFNLDLLRQTYPDFLQACKYFIETYPNVIKLEDQDLLNLLFRGKIKRLPLKWNFYTHFHHCPRDQHYFTEEELLDALCSPNLIHYAAKSNKPWKTHTHTKLKGLYWYWRQKAGLPPRNFQEYLALKLSPCFYLQKNGRNFLHTSFGRFPWPSPRKEKKQKYLGKWQAYL